VAAIYPVALPQVYGYLVELFEPGGQGYHERPSTPTSEERP
jgi:hypothetical protein